MASPGEVTRCECCPEWAYKGEYLCDGCKTDAFVLQQIHARPEGFTKSGKPGSPYKSKAA